MRIRVMRELSPDEIQTNIDDTRKEIVELRFQHAMRRLESPAKMRLARRRLAQLLTVQTEKSQKA